MIGPGGELQLMASLSGYIAATACALDLLADSSSVVQVPLRPGSTATSRTTGTAFGLGPASSQFGQATATAASRLGPAGQHQQLHGHRHGEGPSSAPAAPALAPTTPWAAAMLLPDDSAAAPAQDGGGGEEATSPFTGAAVQQYVSAQLAIEAADRREPSDAAAADRAAAMYDAQDLEGVRPHTHTGGAAIASAPYPHLSALWLAANAQPLPGSAQVRDGACVPFFWGGGRGSHH